MRQLAVCALLLALAQLGAAGRATTVVQIDSAVGRALLGDGEYSEGDAVPLWASKVGPFTNPR